MNPFKHVVGWYEAAVLRERLTQALAQIDPLAEKVRLVEEKVNLLALEASHQKQRVDQLDPQARDLDKRVKELERLVLSPRVTVVHE